MAAMVTAAAVAPSLRERLRGGEEGSGSSQGLLLPAPRDGKDHVLYLLRSAYRAHANPALEVALTMADALGVPCVCCAVVEDSFPPCLSRVCGAPTDRSAAFRLEALRELEPALAARGAVLYVHVERDGSRQAAALTLAVRASLVVSDEHFAVEPHASFLGRVARLTGAPLWLCDTATTVPSVLLLRKKSAALSGGNRGFLKATEKLRAERLAPDWFPPPAPPPTRRSNPADRPAWAIDLDEAAIEGILAAPSRRDTAVGRCAQTRGGPAAASRRWRRYVQGGGLKRYARHRNDPLAKDGDGATRMSAYVNLGMIDPYVMARDAAGSSKFLDEFVGWRETPYLWCLKFPGAYLDAERAIPKWAQPQFSAVLCTSLHFSAAQHDNNKLLEAVEGGRTGDPYWDECQRSLVLAGELHNNLRMTWGKAAVRWHRAMMQLPEKDATAALRLQGALDLLIRLNDKYALDGGAPPSYGGLLWCLGWRDRPGRDGAPTARPTANLARRFKLGDLEQRARMRGRCSRTRGAALQTFFPSNATAVTPTPTDEDDHYAAAAAAAQRKRPKDDHDHDDGDDDDDDDPDDDDRPGTTTPGRALPKNTKKTPTPKRGTILSHFKVVRAAADDE